MGWGESINYVLFKNPTTNGNITTTNSVSEAVGNSTTTPVMSSRMIVKSLHELIGANRHIVRFAGMSGALAVVLGAYGSHCSNPALKEENLKKIFETANRFHFFHTIALLAVPLTRWPAITGSLMIIGTGLFSGVCYYRAISGDSKYNRLAPVGGICLMLAWISLIF